MVYEKTTTYDLKDKSLEEFQKKIEVIMQQNLNFNIKSAKLDDSLFIITFFDEKKDKNLQKDNKVAIFREQDNVYVQIKGELTDDESTRFWSDLEKKLAEKEEVPEIATKKESLIWNLEAELKNLGYLSESNIITFNKMAEKFPENRQKQVIERLKEIEKEFNELQNDGIMLTKSEKAQFRVDLIKLNRKNRQEKIKELIKDKVEVKKELVKEKVEVEKELSKDVIVNMIISSIKEKGHEIEYSEAQDFIDNFQNQFNRLPNKGEISSIALGYIKMKMEEESIQVEEKKVVAEQDFSEEYTVDTFLEGTEKVEEEVEEVSPSDALKEIIKDYDFLMAEEKDYYINLLNNLEFEEQKKIVNNIEIIQSKTFEFPEIDESEIGDLRKRLISLNENEISAQINAIIRERRLEEESLGWDPERALRRLKFLTKPNITSIMKMVKGLSEDKQKQVIERLKEIEKEFYELKEQGIVLTDWEKAQFRIELVKYTEKNRKEKLLELIKDQKEELIINKLHEKIPQLKFEDNKKIVKELIWLSVAEIDQRILKIRDKVQKKLEKKQELFSKSSANTCPECGWPVGSFSKKCPRCGNLLLDWLED